MSDTSLASPQLSRRSLLKVGLFGTAVLATAGVTASLSGCSSATPASGYAVLRLSDLPFLRALIPVVLEGAVPADAMAATIEATLKGMDRSLHAVSPELLKLTQQLFDVLGMAVTRGPLTGIWGAWDNASREDVLHFLERWQNSSLNLLRMGHTSLLQMVQMAWYAQPASWGHCGYPGPPQYAL
ncbi:twin-arginine translocation pathway signal protein [Aquipseudomonas ullengensis]|uniref:Twin-arginine translocation pathway signal protein n=1 Tax=Aquipseudomonas ullengensis TaxID=2759166 RepID=A0A7W4LPG5_9GAMM|nr:twin-arginine translocation pathway signal protein [Pseudomonas ullengensis]MBB2496898.1 twin-arginine translocation pathway signal protein [Pseudomonas ullengensis]